MLVQELQKSIIDNLVFMDYGNKLIFTGEETCLQDLYINELAKKEKAKIIYADSILDIKKSLLANTMMDRNKIFVVRNSNEFIKNSELFKELTPPMNKYLILIYDKVDKRSNFFKDNEKVICNFEKMTTTQLIRIVNKYLPDLKEDNCNYLVEMLNKDYGRLLLEIDKLVVLQKINNKNINELFLDAIEEGLIHQDIDSSIFDLVEAILNKNIVLSQNLLKSAKMGEFDIFSLMGLLYSNYKNLLLMKCSKDVNLSYYIKTKLQKFINLYRVKQLVDKMEIIINIEQGIKSGKIDSEIADEILVLKLLN